MLPVPAARRPVPVAGGTVVPLQHGSHAGLAVEEWEGCDVRGGRGRRIGSAMTVTAALRVWDPACFAEHAGRVAGAVVQAVIDHDLSVSGEGRRLYWAARSCAATSGAEVGTFDKHWGEDKRLTWLAWTGVLDWESSAAGGGAEGTARKAGAVASTKESGAEAAKKTESPVSPCHSAPLRSKRGKRRRRVSVAIR